MKQINLIPEEGRYHFPLKPIILGIILVFLLGANYLVVNNRQEALAALRIELIEELHPFEELQQSSAVINMEEYYQISEKLHQLTIAKNHIASLSRPYWQELFVLSMLAGETEYLLLRKIELNQGKDYLIIEIVAPSLEVGAAYLEQVRNQAAFRDVRLVKGEGKAIGEKTILEVLVLLEE
jgi:hypothetical protein